VGVQAAVALIPRGAIREWWDEFRALVIVRVGDDPPGVLRLRRPARLTGVIDQNKASRAFDSLRDFTTGIQREKEPVVILAPFDPDAR
jgi:hypothetical protein